MQVAWTRHELECRYGLTALEFEPVGHMTLPVPEDNLKDSVLHLLAAFGLTDTLRRRLKKEGISVEAVPPMHHTWDHGPRTLLVCAVRGQQMDTIHYLIKHGANIEVLYERERSLKHSLLVDTIVEGRLEPMQALLDAGASQATLQEAFDNDERFYKSAIYLKPTILKTLLDYGFDPDMIYCSGIDNDAYWEGDHSVIQSRKIIEDARKKRPMTTKQA